MRIKVPKKTLKTLRNYNNKIQNTEDMSEFDKLFCAEYYKLEKCILETQSTSGALFAIREQKVEDGFTMSTESFIKLINDINSKKYLTVKDYFNTLNAVKIIMIDIIYVNIYNQTFDFEKLSYAISTINATNEIDLEELSSQLLRLEQLLLCDPANIYSKQTVKSKASYRSMICRIAKKKHQSEILIAENIINECINTGKHIGFALYDLYNTVFNKSLYQILSFLIPTILSAIASFFLANLSNNYYLIILLLIPFYEIFRVFSDFYILRVIPVLYPPRLQLDNIVPAKYKTCIVLATLIPSEDEIDDFRDKLEKNILISKQEFVKFVVLVDFKESDDIISELDRQNIRRINAIIDELNNSYDNCVLLLVRQREYSATQEKFIGKNRKYGAIKQLVESIIENENNYLSIRGDIEILTETKYIFVLDYDTIILLDTITSFIGTAIHPLHTPVIDSKNAIVESGYGIINPSISLELKSSLNNKFTEIVGGIGGITSYSTLYCEYNQRLFDNSVFTGKGLIDVQVYYTVIHGKIKDETVLSHDMIEGICLCTLFVSDTTVLDSFPSTPASYFKRLHRWVRGDFQNIIFLFNNHFNFKAKLKILSNIFRAVLPIFSWICILNPNKFVTTIGVLSIVLPYLFTTIINIFFGSVSHFTTQSFSNIFTSATHTVLKAFFELAFNPMYAFISLNAGIKALYRQYISKKHLLEWATASQVQNEKSTFVKKIFFYLPNLFSVVILLFNRQYLLAIVCILMYIFIEIYDKNSMKAKRIIPASQYEKLASDVAKMGNYYLDFCNSSTNYLPPDNVQYSPIYRIANRTSPTNIGMMLLSYLSLRDLGIISKNTLYKYVENTISTIEKLEKHFGNLYNWYNTETLEILPNKFVSTVDSGNFVCSLVALKQGLCEFFPHNDKLILRIIVLIEATDLSLFYNKNKNLFSVGYDTENNSLSQSHYDMLMSEARMMSYFAVAAGYAPKSHWEALNRTMSRQDVHTGAISWTGTMFEYFMPELLLHSERGSFAYESLKYCIFCQKNRVKGLDIPYGISESGIYSFDFLLNYQYNPNGVQRIALKSGQDEQLVISPYSSYLTLSLDFADAYKNILSFDKVNCGGIYGYYECIDYTEGRVGENNMQIVRSYMAHHIGMSIVATVNALKSNIMQRRFLSDKKMSRAVELLQEKPCVGGVVMFDQLRREKQKNPDKELNKTEYYGELFPSNPRAALINNGNITLQLTDIGVSRIFRQQISVTQNTKDTLRNSHGTFAYIYINSTVFPMTYAPIFNAEIKYETNHSDRNITYFAKNNDLESTICVTLDQALSVEFRKITVKNLQKVDIETSIVIVIEPALTSDYDYGEPQLPINVSFDDASNSIIASRGEVDFSQTLTIAVGLKEDIKFTYTTDAEKVFTSENARSVKHTIFTDDFDCENCNNIGKIGFIAIKIPIKLKANKSIHFTLLTSVASSKTEAISNILALRKTKHMLAKSIFKPNSMGERIGQTVLSQLLYQKFDSNRNIEARAKNSLSVLELRKYKIYENIILVECFELNNSPRIEVYEDIMSSIKFTGIKCNLVFLCEDLTIVNSVEIAIKEKNFIGNSIIILDKNMLNDNEITLLVAAACHIATRSLVRIETPLIKYIPLKIDPILPINGIRQQFHPIILENDSIGTLATSNSLGHTWAAKPSKLMLTAGSDDEKILLKCDGNVYDLVSGATCEFAQKSAKYRSIVGDFFVTLTVTIPEFGSVKQIEVSIENKSFSDKKVEVCYYTHPVLGVDLVDSRYTIVQKKENSLIITNPNTANASYAISVQPSCENFNFVCDRVDFFSANWCKNSINTTNDICAAISAPIIISTIKNVTFVLEFSN